MKQHTVLTRAPKVHCVRVRTYVYTCCTAPLIAFKSKIKRDSHTGGQGTQRRRGNDKTNNLDFYKKVSETKQKSARNFQAKTISHIKNKKTKNNNRKKNNDNERQAEKFQREQLTV